ncbi:OmpA family membrane protein [Desulfuromonas soudanensis]|uniref:OmpA family membrane protein n=1 Tax=Desulfuromonas soudanensis TaxID=1603606 RepID=A0A0M3QFY0_9BACT|nr:OmpA family membrane protein [Desulfuromonas soudanensis]
MVEGHTDSVGPAAFNLQLSLIRAEKVRRTLIERYGVSAERVEARGFGESLPQADNSTPEGRQKNRRVLVRLLR